MEKKKIKIVVCCHNSVPNYNLSDQFLLLQVGKSLHPDIDLNIQGDDTGNNISAKNNSYCELTGLYWAWKNLDADIIGLCHYRRFFDFHRQGRPFFPYSTFTQEEFKSLDLSIPNKILNRISKGYIVASSPLSNRSSNAMHYCSAHISDDFRLLTDVIQSSQPKNVVDAYFSHMFTKNCASFCNMTVMRKEDFKCYCEWLFSILNEVEHKINISHYSQSQQRIFGYMAERLLDVWIMAQKKKVIHRPVIKVSDTKDIYSEISVPRYLIRKIVNRIACVLTAEHLWN